MFHRKSRKQKKLEEQNTIQNISAPINLFNTSFSASQPTYSFNNGFPSPQLGLNNFVSHLNDPSYSLSQPVVNSPLNSPLLGSNYSRSNSSKLFIKPKENRLNSLTSPPPPPSHNLPSAIFGYSSNGNSQLPSPPLQSSRSSRSVDRPSRSVSVRNQDFVYSSSPSSSSNNVGTISRGRSKNRDLDSYDSSNNSFLNFSSSFKHSEKETKKSNKEEKKSDKREEKKSEREKDEKKYEKETRKSKESLKNQKKNQRNPKKKQKDLIEKDLYLKVKNHLNHLKEFNHVIMKLKIEVQVIIV